MLLHSFPFRAKSTVSQSRYHALYTLMADVLAESMKTTQQHTMNDQFHGCEHM